MNLELRYSTTMVTSCILLQKKQEVAGSRLRFVEMCLWVWRRCHWKTIHLTIHFDPNEALINTCWSDSQGGLISWSQDTLGLLIFWKTGGQFGLLIIALSCKRGAKKIPQMRFCWKIVLFNLSSWDYPVNKKVGMMHVSTQKRKNKSYKHILQQWLQYMIIHCLLCRSWNLDRAWFVVYAVLCLADHLIVNWWFKLVLYYNRHLLGGPMWRSFHIPRIANHSSYPPAHHWGETKL